jgi:hypothetical protein
MNQDDQRFVLMALGLMKRRAFLSDDLIDRCPALNQR